MSGLQSFTVAVGLPPRELGGNSRVHWKRRSSATRAYRQDCWVLIGVELATTKIRLPLDAVVVSFEVYQGKRRGANGKVAKDNYYRGRDCDNVLRSMKAFMDALVDVGVVASDDHKHIQLGGLKIIGAKESGEKCGVWVTVKEVE